MPGWQADTSQMQQLSNDDKVLSVKGVVFDIQRFAIHDGPGIRTLVFLKGCPLHCQWCDNPESINPRPELAFIKARCNKCGKCSPACPEQAINLDCDGMPKIDRAVCTSCGDCISVCLPQALHIYGKKMTPEEVLHEVQLDEIFYRSSGGGVTVSGGEPLQQSSFITALFGLCRQAGIHTALETTGFAARKVLEEIAPLTDYLLFDLKHMDTKVHEEFCGRPNMLILENAEFLVSLGLPILFRMPLIPGVNDTPDNIRETASFLRTLQGSEATIELMPYHRLGLAKYEALDRPFTLRALEPMSPAQVEAVRAAFEAEGARCKVSK